MKYKIYNFRKLCPEVSSTTYLTHGIHSYTAKFIPQMPKYFIKKYCSEGDTVLDPFCGSGTALLEANILKNNAIGIDINPLARLIAKVKTTPINPNLISNTNKLIKNKLKKRIKLSYDVEFYNKHYWFHKKAIIQLRKILTIINQLYNKNKINRNLKDYYYVCVSSIIRKSSYADLKNPKTYCSPRMRKKRMANIPTKPIKYFLDSINVNYNKMKEAFILLNNNGISTKFVSTNDATNINLPYKVDLIVTSPPYSNAQEYFRNIKLELFWLKLANKKEINLLDKKQIGGENQAFINFNEIHLTKIPVIDTVIKKVYNKDRKKAYVVYKYFYNMKKNISECSRILKKGKHFVIIVGNNSVKGYEIPIHKGLIEIAKNYNFKLYQLGYDLIKNRTFMIKRNNNANPINKDWVIDLVKL